MRSGRVEGGLRVRFHEEHDELLAAVSARGVDAADGPRDGARDGRQRGVSSEVPEAVVEALEVVDVEHRDREAPARAARAGELGQGALLEGGAVQEAGQRIRGGAREEAPLLLGDAREKERREEDEPGAER